jgi:hypothetical protein
VFLGIASLVSVGVSAAAGHAGSTTGVGGGSAVVAPCGTGITASYTTAYVASIPGYSVSQVNLAGIPAGCLSKSYRIQLTGAGDAAIGSEMAGTLPPSGTTADIATADTSDASLVTGVSVVVS